MAWSVPRTWVSSEVITASIMNTHIRDNFLETSAATVTTAGDLAYADAANSMGNRIGLGANQRFLYSDGTAPGWFYHSIFHTTLTNDQAAAFDTYEQWGTEENRATSQAGENAQITAFLFGYTDVSLAGAAERHRSRVRCRISLNDGSTWSNGSGVIDDMDTDSRDFAMVSTAHHVNGAVTTAAIAQAQLYEGDQGHTVGDIQFDSGRLITIFMPD